MKIYTIEGKRWIIVSEAARLLKTNSAGIRKMMGDGQLDWRQTRANSSIFVVDEITVMALARVKGLTPSVRTKPTDKLPKMIEGGRRVRGGLWTDHHLRLTLPLEESQDDRRKPRFEAKIVGKGKTKAGPGSSPG